MPIIIDEVRGELEPEPRRDQDSQPAPARPSQPREIEIEEALRNLRFYERRMQRLRAD